MANIRGPQSSTENAIKMAASKSTSAASSRKVYWQDRGVTLLLEAVRENESLWSTKSVEYKNRKVKETQYEQVLQVIKEELPDVDLGSLKGMPSTVILYVNNIIEIIVNIKRQCNFGPNPGLLELAADKFSTALPYT